QFVHHVIDPDDVGVFGADFRFRFAGTDHVLRFVQVRSIVAIGHALGVEADHFAAAGHQVNAVALHAGRRKQAQTLPVVHLAGGELGNDELPEKSAGFFVETKQNAAVALMLRVARIFIVGADENFAPGDDDV